MKSREGALRDKIGSHKEAGTERDHVAVGFNVFQRRALPRRQRVQQQRVVAALPLLKFCLQSFI